HANVPHLALSHDVVEGAHGLVERRVGIRPMDEVHVDVVRVQALQALLDRRDDAPTGRVATGRPVGIAHAELGHDHDLAPPLAERLPQRPLRDAHAVRLGGVEAVDASIEGLLHGEPELALVDPAVRAADLPAPESDRRDLEAGLAELAIFHAAPVFCRAATEDAGAGDR